MQRPPSFCDKDVYKRQAYVNSITAPIIAENTARSQDAARAELLPAADSFEQYDGDLVVLSPDQVYVSDCYVATNGSGIVVTVESSSYGGLLTAMVGVDSEGAVTGVQVTAHKMCIRDSRIQGRRRPSGKSRYQLYAGSAYRRSGLH